MKILIATYHLQKFEGTETYVYALTRYLRNMNIEIVVYSPYLGKIEEIIRDNNINVVDNLEQIKCMQFDVIHAQHNIIAIQTRIYFPRTPLVLNVHGVLPELERLAFIKLGISKYIAVSEEVKDSLMGNNIIDKDVKIIRNFIDTKRFFEKMPINKNLRNILVISNRTNKENRKIINEVADELNLNLKIIGLEHESVWDVENYINKADLVISLGRGILEAMSAGRAAIVYGYNGGDGMITKESYFEIRKNNFSGRRYGKRYKKYELARELKKYKYIMGKENSKIVAEEHSADKNVKKLLMIYQNLIVSEKKNNNASIVFKVLPKCILIKLLPSFQFVINKVVKKLKL